MTESHEMIKRTHKFFSEELRRKQVITTVTIGKWLPLTRFALLWAELDSLFHHYCRESGNNLSESWYNDQTITSRCVSVASHADHRLVTVCEGVWQPNKSWLDSSQSCCVYRSSLLGRIQMFEFSHSFLTIFSQFLFSTSFTSTTTCNWIYSDNLYITAIRVRS